MILKRGILAVVLALVLACTPLTADFQVTEPGHVPAQAIFGVIYSSSQGVTQCRAVLPRACRRARNVIWP